MKTLYEINEYRVVEKEEAAIGIHIQVKQGDAWDTGVWDGKVIIKSLLNDIKNLKVALETEKMKRFYKGGKDD